MQKSILAIEAAPAAIPPNPNIAAIIAITKKIKVQRNIKKGFMVNKFFNYNTQRIVPFSIIRELI